MTAKTRIAALLATTLGMLLATALPAAAADDSTANEGFSVTDSHGIPADDFQLAMWAGNAWDTANWFWNMCMSFPWEIYRSIVTFAIGLLEWALDLVWVDWLLTPLKGLEKITGSFMDQMGLMPLMLAVLGAVVGWWILKGRYAGGLIELIVGCTIAALAVGLLSHPMTMIAGPDDGWIYQARDAGQEISTAVATDGRVEGGADLDQSQGTVSSLMDTLVRMPHQIINYGSVIDGTKCESVYDEQLTSGNDLTQIREAIGACDKQYKEHSDHPDVVKTVNVLNLLLVVLPSFALFSFALVAMFILAVLGAAWQAIKLVVLLVAGVMPGGPRASLMRAASNTGFALLMIALTSVFVTVWMIFVNAFFAESEALPFLVRVRLFGLMLVIGAIALFVARHKVKKAMHRLGDRLAQLGANSASYQPSKMPGQVADRGFQMWLHRRKPAKVPGEDNGHTEPENPPKLDSKPPRIQLDPAPGRKAPRHLGPGASGTTPQLPPGSAPRPPWAPKGPFNQPPGAPVAGVLTKGPSKALVLRSRLGTATKAVAHGGAMLASGGSSAAITGAKIVAAGAKAGTAARAGATAAKAASTARAVSRSAKVARSVQAARAHALRTKLAEAQMRPHRAGMVDRTTGVTYRQHTARAGAENVEVYKPSGIDPGAVEELRARLKPARMPAQKGER